MNLVVIDCETTGLNPSQHEIIEIGAVKVEGGESFSCKISPRHLVDADPVALQKNGYTPERWEGAVSQEDALRQLSVFAGEWAYMVGYNVSFDRAFLSKAYWLEALDYPFNYHHLDIMSAVWQDTGRVLTLQQACLFYSIKPEPEIHMALVGAYKALEILKSLKK